MTSIFISVGLAEQTGHGIPIITELSGKDAFDIGGHYLDVRIGYNFEPDYTALRKAKDFLTNDLTEYQKNIVNYLLKNPSATMKEISVALSVSESGVKKAMSHLQTIGLVKRKGSKKTGEGVITP